ncbi:3-oxoacyl-[acyl-carrier-protein] synthase III C-terminal domain-containing protein [Streptomyces sp. NPDC090303]|uniref:3-oxoacyl-[acyl-carrier-protein] synthase III C-terminal domain-containing protein n=1 Tax=Streptomyces sp. NPDC090303 TaxID=3365960 RepID=UPI0038238485
MAATTGRIVPLDEWADRVRLAHRNRPGDFLNGEDLRHIFGVRGKSFAPDHFATLDPVVETARSALSRAHLTADDLDALIVATGSSYGSMLDQDAFTLARLLDLPDHVAPLQMGTGCAGVARAAAHLCGTGFRHVLFVTYFVPSVAMFTPDGELMPAYRDTRGPLVTWAAPVTFSDAAAAVVLTRTREPGGVALYSRDSLAFGDAPGRTDPLVHYVEGTLSDGPPAVSAQGHTGHYALNPPEIRAYYPQGMMLNHASLLEADPDYPRRVGRIYTHQAGPELVRSFVRASGLPAHKVPSNAEQLGNTVSASTLLMLDQDLTDGTVSDGDDICVSVVGSGPERGALIAPLRIPTQ